MTKLEQMLPAVEPEITVEEIMEAILYYEDLLAAERANNGPLPKIEMYRSWIQSKTAELNQALDNTAIGEELARDYRLTRD